MPLFEDNADGMGDIVQLFLIKNETADFHIPFRKLMEPIWSSEPMNTIGN